MWSPGSGRMHASGWVSSLSESSLTKSCQLSNCQWAIWVRQHLSEEFGLSTHQGKNTSNTIGLTNTQQVPQSRKELKLWSDERKSQVMSCLNFPGTTSAIGKGPNSLKWQTTPCLIIWPHLSSSLLYPWATLNCLTFPPYVCALSELQSFANTVLSANNTILSSPTTSIHSSLSLKFIVLH